MSQIGSLRFSEFLHSLDPKQMVGSYSVLSDFGQEEGSQRRN